MTEQEYFDNTIQELYDKFPAIPVKYKHFLNLVLKYRSGNELRKLKDRKEYVDKNVGASYMRDIIEATGVPRRFEKQPHRPYILEELLGINEADWEVQKDEFVNKNTAYAHEEAEKPSSAQVVEFLASQETSVLQQIVQLLPKLSEKEWQVVDSYRAAL